MNKECVRIGYTLLLCLNIKKENNTSCVNWISKEFKSLTTYSMERLYHWKNKLINVYMAKERIDVL